MPIETNVYGVRHRGGSLETFTVTLPGLGASDLLIRIQYCGVGRGDLHQVSDDWGSSQYPLVPGHEIIGKVVEIGSRVTKFKANDIVGIGAFIGSCKECSYCKTDNENKCPKRVFTYNSTRPDGSTTYGGFARAIVVNEAFALRIPPGLLSDLPAAAPLLCGGITVYSPMVHYGMTAPGRRIGVLGLGGLGYLAVRFGAAFGAHVTVISTSGAKRDEAMQLGAHQFIVADDTQQLKQAEKSLDFIIDTVAAPRDVEAYLHLLKIKGVLVELSVPKDFALKVVPGTLVHMSRGVVGSICGGVKETQAMLDFCASRQIVAKVEVIKMREVNEAFDRMLASQAHDRFVIDVENSKF